MITSHSRTKAAVLVLSFAILLLASRVPFLDAGYGVNVDAWRVARVARNIVATGSYEASRSPGYPVHEIASSWLWRGGPFALNGGSAVLSIAAVMAFWAFAARLHIRDRILASVALALTPIFYISSVTSKDYVWGLAAGCRLTSLAMLLPVAMILIGASERKQRLRNVTVLALSCGVVSALVFWPVLARYGLVFITFYETHARPDWGTVLERGTIEVWGTIGLVGLLVAVIGFVLARVRPGRWQPAAVSRFQNPCVAPALAVIIVVYAAAYFRLPDQAGYLLPVIPATLLLAGLYVPRLCFQIFCLTLIVAPFVEISTGGLAAGPIFADRRERLRTIESIRNFVHFSRSLPGRNLILVGGWEPQIDVLFPDAASGNIRYVYLLSEEQLKTAISDGFTVYYLPAIRAFNASVYGIDVAKFGARDLRAIYEERARDREKETEQRQ
jgi:cbb3-type cytochrome oxidase subunit 3